MNGKIFLKELRHWSLHTTICASPSFIMAIQFGFNSTIAIVGMLCGIATLILGYTCISSTNLFAGNSDGILNQTKKYGLRARSTISLIELPGALIPESVLFNLTLPDFYAGMVAVSTVDTLTSGFSENNHTFFQVYAATIIEGLIVSISIFLLMLLLLLTIKGFKKLIRFEEKFQ